MIINNPEISLECHNRFASEVEDLTVFLKQRFPILYMEFGRNEQEAQELELLQERAMVNSKFEDGSEITSVDYGDSYYMENVIETGTEPYTVGYGNAAIDPSGSTYMSTNPAPAGHFIPELAHSGYDFKSETNMMIKDMASTKWNHTAESMSDYIAKVYKPIIQQKMKEAIAT